MLVLTRRLDEGIRVGRDVRIVVLEISGDQVRLGIAAPRDQAILRDELFARAAEANSDAAVSLGASSQEAPSPGHWIQLEHTKLGALRFPARDVIEIEEIAGFSHARRFVLIAHDRGEGIGWLASCEDPALAFPIVDLRSIRADVCDDLSSEELSRVGADDASQVELLGILTTHDATPRPNLDAPLLIHGDTRRGTQLIRERPIALA